MLLSYNNFALYTLLAGGRHCKADESLHQYDREKALQHLSISE